MGGGGGGGEKGGGQRVPAGYGRAYREMGSMMVKMMRGKGGSCDVMFL